MSRPKAHGRPPPFTNSAHAPRRDSPGFSTRVRVENMLYGEPETTRFLAAIQRLKRVQRKRERLTRQAKQRIRAVLRKMREC